MSTAATPTKLSRRQAACLRLAADGHTDAQIAGQIASTEAAVSSALRQAYRKLGATCRANAVHLAWQAGYLGGDA